MKQEVTDARFREGWDSSLTSWFVSSLDLDYFFPKRECTLTLRRVVSCRRLTSFYWCLLHFERRNMPSGWCRVARCLCSCRASGIVRIKKEKNIEMCVKLKNWERASVTFHSSGFLEVPIVLAYTSCLGFCFAKGANTSRADCFFLFGSYGVSQLLTCCIAPAIFKYYWQRQWVW